MRSVREPRPGETKALYVQLPTPEAEKLDRAAFELGAHKRDLVTALVARHVDPSSADGLERLRELGVHAKSQRREEIPLPGPERPPTREPERDRSAPSPPTLYVGRASEWTAGMHRAIRDFARGNDCPAPFVAVTLDDGERLLVETLAAGPGDNFVTVSAYGTGKATTRTVVVRLDAIRKVEVLRDAPTATEQRFVFRPREHDVGFRNRHVGERS
jgi:hypothetical protein